MAEIKAFFTSYITNEPELMAHDIADEEATRNKCVFGYHDIYSGSVLYGVDRGDRVGADIYFFENVHTDPMKAHNAVMGLVNPQNSTERIMPFGHSKKFRVQKDSGEPGTIHLVHSPILPKIHIRYI